MAQRNGDVIGSCSLAYTGQMAVSFKVAGIIVKCGIESSVRRGADRCCNMTVSAMTRSSQWGMQHSVFGMGNEQSGGLGHGRKELREFLARSESASPRARLLEQKPAARLIRQTHTRTSAMLHDWMHLTARLVLGIAHHLLTV